MASGYVELSPDRISKEILLHEEGKLHIAAPIIITTEDDRILLLGRKGAFGRRLPTINSRNNGVARYGKPFDLSISMLGRLFSNTSEMSDPDEYHYLGLLKDRTEEGRLVIPILAELDYVSEDPKLLACEDWKSRHHDHPEFYWVDLDSLPDLVVNAGVRTDDLLYGVSPPVATMLNYYLEHDTYVPDVAQLSPLQTR